MADFVHLHNHSEFSLLDGLSKIPAMLTRAKDLGMKAMAITDHGSLYGAIKFYNDALQIGIKPIIGSEVYMAKRKHTDRDAEKDADQNHLILLAQNDEGYKNLIKLVTISHLEGFYYKPRIDLELLEKYKEGLVCLSGCVNGYVSEPLLHGRTKEAREKAEKLAKIFPSGHFYLELQKHQNNEEQNIANERLIALSAELGIPLVATNDCHYINPTDAQAQETLLCIQTQDTILNKNRKLSMINSPDFYIRSSEEMMGLFLRQPEAIENAIKIAAMVNLEIERGKWILPVFPVPEPETPSSYIKNLVSKRIKNRYKKVTEEIRQRVEYELSVIIQKGYATYFLIVQDFVNWAKLNGIAVGPGRGSISGSIVSYILGITDLDPLEYKLPFERFLNPQRPSPPDIDVDFADDRRDEVIEYVTKKYGKGKVAQIITFGTMEARGSVRDVGRALGMPYKDPDRIAKMIPPGTYGFSMTIDKALQQSPELSLAYQNEPETRKLLDLARKLEGVARHASTHAAGVVIADRDLTNYTPLQREVKGERIITQYDMYDLDLNISDNAIGLLKMDFLGLRNLTILQNAIKFVEKNKKIKIDLTKIPLDDSTTYQLISSGETTGIFQIESAGMRRLARDLKPSRASDLSAMVALFRPGPMNWIDDFISAKANPKKIKYLHEDLRPILEETYGIAVYQEQCMQIANVMGGYTLAEADNLRKAIGKKKPELMKKEREKFIKGCLKNGYSQKIAEDAFALIEKFVGYGFNKAHSAAYGLIAYQTGYMKANFTVEFMTALLTAETRSSTGPVKNEKISQVISECRRMKIKVLSPDINKSGTDFSIEESDKIRFGLSAIKNVGEAAIASILKARKSANFTNIRDFCQRVDLTKVNKKTLESLIKAGAMDIFGKRASQLASLQDIMLQIHRDKKNQSLGQTTFLDTQNNSNLKYQMMDIPEFGRNELLAFERELLGFYLSEHPLNSFVTKLSTKITHDFVTLFEEKDGAKIKIGGIVSRVRIIYTKKNGSEMAFVLLENEVGATIECIIFPKIFARTRDIWSKDNIILVDGHLDAKSERVIVIVDQVWSLSS